MTRRSTVLALITLCTVLFPRFTFAQLPQQGSKLIPTGTVGASKVGYTIAVSADGMTAIVGAREDNNLTGAAWIFTRNAGIWNQQGPKLVATDAAPATSQGVSVSISADGNTVIVGGETTSSVGAAWIWTRNDGTWSQQSKLVGSGAVGNAGQGSAVALSGDGNTAIVGGFFDSAGTGAAWIWTRSAGAWTQQGPKLVGSGSIGNAQQGYAVALSFDGSTAIVGGFNDNSLKGAAWIWTRSANGAWSQQGGKLVGSNSSAVAGQGKSVALSSDGNTAIVGGYFDNNMDGAAWVWSRNGGTWTQQGSKFTAPAGVSSAVVGWSVSLSGDGNTALVGAPGANGYTGAAWVWTRSGSTWTRQVTALVGTGAVGNGSQGSSQGSSVALSEDAATAMIGGTGDNNGTGAAWVFSSVTTTVPTLSLDRTTLAFTAADNGIAFTTQTSAQTVRLTQAGSGTLTWTAVSNVPWLVVTPSAGSASRTLSVSVQFVPGLVASQVGIITITPAGANTTTGPLHITAALSVLIPSTAGPFGIFDTPMDGTTGVTGSIAVTGWALDDIEVTRVRILRAPVTGEPAGLVFIGDAVLVDGARPDVQAAYPSMPRNTRAGWGYLMLTNFLPSLGNGTFTLYAIADDAEGHSTTLGTKTITCTNSTATDPTGAIDTPAQGGVVSGTVTNFGWVLSPDPYYADPPHGGTVQVVIDGAFLGTAPSGWTNRPDLTALFPASAYPGINTALGVASFDSLSLGNGVHTIAWVVTDNNGHASGIGSRYFTVSNGSQTLAPAAAPLTAVSSMTLAGAMPAAPIRGRRGFDPATPLQTYQSHDGRVTVQAEELDRIELQLGQGAAYSAHLRTGDAIGPLPAGSAFEPATGMFTWMPGVGFSGAYDFVFLQSGGSGEAMSRREVRIVLNPKGSNRVGPQTVIDSAPAVAGESFDLAGWAADLDSTLDRGVDTVHVWAYKVDGAQPSDPIWLGVATYGGERPDVAAIFGARFLHTGYGLTVAGLPSGTYDIAVFAYSTVLGRFAPAKTTRVMIR